RTMLATAIRRHSRIIMATPIRKHEFMLGSLKTLSGPLAAFPTLQVGGVHGGDFVDFRTLTNSATPKSSCDKTPALTRRMPQLPRPTEERSQSPRPALYLAHFAKTSARLASLENPITRALKKIACGAPSCWLAGTSK